MMDPPITIIFLQLVYKITSFWPQLTGPLLAHNDHDNINAAVSFKLKVELQVQTPEAARFR